RSTVHAPGGALQARALQESGQYLRQQTSWQFQSWVRSMQRLVNERRNQFAQCTAASHELTARLYSGRLEIHRQCAFCARCSEPKWRNWQTRVVQVHVLAREWRFESSFRHQISEVRTKGRAPTLPFVASEAVVDFPVSPGNVTNGSNTSFVRPLSTIAGCRDPMGKSKLVFRQLLRLLTEKPIAQPADRSRVYFDRPLALRCCSSG